jgi:hypothetical protein
MSTIEVNTVDSVGSTLTIGSTNTSTIALKSGATLTNFPNNTPAFAANLASDFTATEDAAVKVAFATEKFDTDGKYDNSTNYRFTPGVAGKYYCYLRIGFKEHNTSTGSVSADAEIDARIYKNGSSISHSGNHSAVSSLQGVISVFTAVIEDFNTTDYIEAYVGLQNNDVNANLLSNAAYNEFGAFRLGT